MVHIAPGQIFPLLVITRDHPAMIYQILVDNREFLSASLYVSKRAAY